MGALPGERWGMGKRQLGVSLTVARMDWRRWSSVDPNAVIVKKTDNLYDLAGPGRRRRAMARQNPVPCCPCWQPRRTASKGRS
jgi:hypothetical protein